MNKTKFLSVLTAIFITIACFFSPFIYVNNAAIPVYLLKNFLAILPFILVIASSILFVIKKEWSYLLGIIFSFSSFIYLICLRTIAGLDDSLKFATGYYVITAISFILSLIGYYIFNSKSAFTVGDVVEIGIFVSLAVVLDLSFFKIRIGQNGGSISISMLPLFILSYRKGFLKGFIGSGIVYGLITCFLDGWGFFTYPFDYLLAYGSIGLAGLFQGLIFNKTYKFKIKGLIFVIISTLIAVISRTLFATLSGMIFYDLTFIPSLDYQLVYIVPSSVAVLALNILLYKPLLLSSKLSPINK